MTFITAVKYDVREDILHAWLFTTFGANEANMGDNAWSYRVGELISSDAAYARILLNTGFCLTMNSR